MTVMDQLAEQAHKIRETFWKIQSLIHKKTMERTKLVQKIVTRALQGGWNPSIYEVDDSNGDRRHDHYLEMEGDQREHAWNLLVGTMLMNPWEIVFKHDFAKAFWGEDPYEGPITTIDDRHRITAIPFPEFWGPPAPRWLYHLQKMVLEKEPLEYLAQFIDDEQ